MYMIKPLIILFNTVSVFLFTFFFGDTPVTITGNFPTKMKLSEEVITEIKINKGTIGGFAKLQIDVPEGLTVKELESKSGNFTYANNIAKIIWTSVPSESEFTVKFVFVASAEGKKTITSKYSFINNNAKESVEMTPVEIEIGEGSSATTAVAVNEQPKETPKEETPKETTPVSNNNQEVTQTPVASQTPANPSSNENDANVICSRVISAGASANEINVEVKINKPNIRGFAKYQDLLPQGYTAKQGKVNGSSFSVSDGKIKFVWVSLPLEDELVISYTLEKSESASPEVNIEGEFSYLENDQTKKIKAKTDTYTFSSSVVASKPNNTENVTNQETVSSQNAASNQTETKKPATTNTQIAKREGNVSYLVQIGAFKNAIESDVLTRKFNLSETVKSEMAEGYSKFMVGNFGEYKEARNHREKMKGKGCGSAFVVAYNGPKRITVQEALMITSQKWYK
jgi:hypothetical protein